MDNNSTYLLQSSRTAKKIFCSLSRLSTDNSLSSQSPYVHISWNTAFSRCLRQFHADTQSKTCEYPTPHLIEEQWNATNIELVVIMLDVLHDRKRPMVATSTQTVYFGTPLSNAIFLSQTERTPCKGRRNEEKMNENESRMKKTKKEL